MIADPDRKVADLYDMIHPNADDTLTVRSVFIVAPDNTVKLTLTYPASTGRNFDELLRVIDSLQLTAERQLATPADWTHGDRVIVGTGVSTDEAQERFANVEEVALLPALRRRPHRLTDPARVDCRSVKRARSAADGQGMDPDRWRFRGRYLAGLPVLALMGLNAFVRGVRVPLLGWIDLAIHEAGHVLAFPLPDIGMAAMGSGLQVAMPLLFAAVFWFRERDALGTALTLGWAGTSFQDASVYIADAPFQRLALIGGEHDWAWVLGPRGLDRLEPGRRAGRLVWVGGLVLWTVGLLLCLAGPAPCPGAGGGASRPRPVARCGLPPRTYLPGVSTTRTFRLPLPLDVQRSLAPLQMGRWDPTMRLTPTETLRAAWTPDGAATLHARVSSGEATCEAWGPGADWALEHAPGLLGAHDDLTGFAPDQHATVARCARRLPGVRMIRSGRVTDLLVPDHPRAEGDRPGGLPRPHRPHPSVRRARARDRGTAPAPPTRPRWPACPTTPSTGPGSNARGRSRSSRRAGGSTGWRRPRACPASRPAPG